MNFSPHFTSDEFVFSQTAARLGIANDPGPAEVRALTVTAQGLELVRAALGGAPILISSGYRSPALNAAVHGAEGSQHLLGEAVDFTAPTVGTPQEVMRHIVGTAIPYDQIILEFGRWIHISFSNRNRRQALVVDSMGARPWTS